VVVRTLETKPKVATDPPAGGDRIEDMTDRVVAPRDPQRSRILPMKSTSRDGDHGASRTVLDHLRAADVALRREAREAVEAGNLETFLTRVAEYLRAPAPGSPDPRMAEELLDCVDWDWVAGAYLADPPGPVATGLPPVDLEG
jgi:hypothetical protein